MLGGSTDSEFVHWAWRKHQDELRDLPFPLLADLKRELTTALGILGDAGAIATLRRVERTDSQLTVQIDAWNAIMTIRDAEAMRAARP